MNEKHKQVRTWLECKFAGEKIPAYEISQRTVGELYDLKQRNEARDKDMQLVVEEMRQATQEYKAEARRERAILEQVLLTPSALSQSGVTSLRTLVSLATVLKIKDTTDTNYLLALGELSRELFRVSEARKMEERSSNQLLNKTKAAVIKSSELKQSLDALNEQAAHQTKQCKVRSKQIGFLQAKATEYNTALQKTKAKLHTIGLDPSIYHRNLVKKAEEIQALEDKLHPLKAKLRTYHSLPPDLTLTKVKIEELQREMDVLEMELTREINVMHL